MEAKSLVEKYNNRIHGVLHCYDRIVLMGTLPRADPRKRRETGQR